MQSGNCDGPRPFQNRFKFYGAGSQVFDVQIRLQEETLHALKGMEPPYKLRKHELYSAYSSGIWF